METVTKCTKIKDWNGKPIYQVEMSNGAIGESFNQEIPIGTPEDQLTFTTNGTYADKVKWNDPAKIRIPAWNKMGAKGGNESFALSYAKDIACAHIEKGREFKAEEVVKVAEVFYVWLQSKKS